VFELLEDAEHVAALLGADGEEGQGELEAGGQDLARQGARCAIDGLQLSLLGRPFEDREPLGPVELVVGARRTWHVRLDDPSQLGGLELPRGVPYAYTVESDVPIVVQHSRLDTSAGYTLFTSIAYGE